MKQIEWVKVPTVDGKKFETEEEAQAYIDTFAAAAIVDAFIAADAENHEGERSQRYISRERNLLLRFELWRLGEAEGDGA